MAEFYTNVQNVGNQIYLRGFKDGKRIQKKTGYSPKLFTKSNKITDWKTLDGKYLDKKTFTSIFDARGYVKKYKEVDNLDIYGNQRFDYAFIADNYGKMDYDTDLVSVASIDIEVEFRNGFPEPAKAENMMTAITIYINKKYHSFAFKEDYKPKRANATYHKCTDEADMLVKFYEIWNKEGCPDIITGWNVNLFDVPYLINRTIKLLGQEVASYLSPWKEIKLREKKIGSKTFQMYEIVGIAIVDYLDLYKKYSPTPNQETYKLDNIAEVELDKKKVDYSAYGNLNDLYDKNFELYMDYNIEDVGLVVELEDKLKLMVLVMVLAYNAKVNYDDVFSQVRMWDTIIFNKLQERNIAIPPKRDTPKLKEYAGAYVKEPLIGMFKWLASFDLTSLYPHLIMMYNISPETLLQPTDYDEETREFMRVNGANINVDSLLARKIKLDFLKRKQLTLTPNGQLFRTDIKGFLPELMEEMFAARKAYKDKEIEAKTKNEQTDDKAIKAELKKLAAKFKALQNAFKVTLNSAYGAIGNEFFRFFDIRIAEAVTLSGQLAIRWIQESINAYFNKILKTKGEDYVIASDTDSIYLWMEKLIDMTVPDQSDTKKVIDIMDKFCEKQIKPYIDKSYGELAIYVNAYAQKMIMKREALCDKAIWTAKKRYILNVYDNEGIKYKEPDIKIMGLEAIKSSTPKICKTKIKAAIKVILNKDEHTLQEFVAEFREEFKKQRPYDIASPRGVNNMTEYSDPRTVYGFKTPIHVRGSLIFNHYVREKKLEKKYVLIKDGDKIKFLYLKEPNEFRSNIIAFIDEIPSEFNITNVLDYDTQFDKTFAEPLTIILKSIGWNLEKHSSLDSFFG